MKKLVFIFCINSLFSMESTQELLQGDLNKAFILLKENKFDDAENIYKSVCEDHKDYINESSEAAFAVGFIEMYYKNNNMGCRDYFSYANERGILPAFLELKYSKAIDMNIPLKIENYSTVLSDRTAKYYSETKEDKPIFFHVLGMMQNNLHKNTEKAKEYYKKGSEQGYGGSSRNLGILYEKEGNIEKAKEYFTKGYEQGDVFASTNLGNLYLKEGNIEKAKECYAKGSEQGDGFASTNLGNLYLKEGNIEKAKEYYAKGYEQGDVFASRNLGILYLKEGNIEKAKECYAKGSEQGDSYASRNLGILYLKEGNIEKAKEYYTKGSKQGDGGSSRNLGNLYEKEGNIEKAKEYYAKGSVQGDSGSSAKLGFYYEKEGNIEKAKEYYAKGSEQGDGNSSCMLGILYEEEGNIDKAKEYYTKGSEQGDGYSSYRLGLLYEKEGNIEKAREYYKLAIKRRFAIAAFFIGLTYEQEGNIDKSKKYYMIGCELRDNLSSLKLYQIYKKENNAIEAKKFLNITHDIFAEKNKCSLISLGDKYEINNNLVRKDPYGLNFDIKQMPDIDNNEWGQIKNEFLLFGNDHNAEEKIIEILYNGMFNIGGDGDSLTAMSFRKYAKILNILKEEAKDSMFVALSDYNHCGDGAINSLMDFVIPIILSNTNKLKNYMQIEIGEGLKNLSSPNLINASKILSKGMNQLKIDLIMSDMKYGVEETEVSLLRKLESFHLFNLPSTNSMQYGLLSLNIDGKESIAASCLERVYKGWTAENLINAVKNCLTVDVNFEDPQGSQNINLLEGLSKDLGLNLYEKGMDEYNKDLVPILYISEGKDISKDYYEDFCAPETNYRKVPSDLLSVKLLEKLGYIIKQN